MGDILEFGAVVAIVMGAVFAFRIGGVLIKRLERPQSEHSVRELEERVGRLEEFQEQQPEADARLLELEERVDFAERMLEQRRRLSEPKRQHDSIG